MDMILDALEYKPGHVSQWYSNGLWRLVTLKPAEPKDGDLMAEYTANGEWDFTLDGAPDAPLTGRYTNPDDITPEIETAFDGLCDGDTFSVDGHQYTYRCANNNWFEWFVFQYEGGTWHEIAFDVDDSSLGPTVEQASGILQSALQEQYAELGVTNVQLQVKEVPEPVTLQRTSLDSI